MGEPAHDLLHGGEGGLAGHSYCAETAGMLGASKQRRAARHSKAGSRYATFSWGSNTIENDDMRQRLVFCICSPSTVSTYFLWCLWFSVWKSWRRDANSSSPPGEKDLHGRRGAEWPPFGAVFSFFFSFVMPLISWRHNSPRWRLAHQRTADIWHVAARRKLAPNVCEALAFY